MNTLVKFFGISALALGLTACGGASGGSSTSSGDGSKNNSGQNGDKINGLYKTFTTCERTSANSTEQALFERICGQHDITFTNTGNKGVLRFTGSLINWDTMNKGLMAGMYDNWQNFYLSVFMKGDEGLGLAEEATASKFMYEVTQIYSNFSEQQASYSLASHSDNRYVLTVNSRVNIGTSVYFPTYADAVITLDIQLGSSTHSDVINGKIEIGTDTTVTFTAHGKPVPNDPLLTY